MAKIICFVWLIIFLVLAVRTERCPPLRSDTLQITCSFGIGETNCRRRQSPGTLARVMCKYGFTTLQPSYLETYCLTSGRWDKPLFNCSIGCGRRNAVTTLGEGHPKVVEFPWHVGIYRLEGGGYRQQCGGTLIAPQVVLTAAQCFWDSATTSPRDVSEFKVAAGKVTRAWDDPDPRVQKREVLRVDLNRYRDREDAFRNDVAVVFLREPMAMTDNVNLVCLDWDSRLDIQPDDVGVLPGWGHARDYTAGDHLTSIQLPFMSESTCYEVVPRGKLSLLSWDKFCAGHTIESTDLCPWDYGGGLVFFNRTEDRYYVRGIASNNFRPSADGRCYAESFASFTDVKYYKDWIHTTMLNNTSTST